MVRVCYKCGRSCPAGVGDHDLEWGYCRNCGDWCTMMGVDTAINEVEVALGRTGSIIVSLIKTLHDGRR